MKLKLVLQLASCIGFYGTIQAAPTKKVNVGRTEIYSWKNEKYNGDERAYHTIAISIDKAIAAGQKATALAEKYKGEAKAKWYDPKLQFRWGYAARKAALSSQPLDRGILVGVAEAMDRAQKVGRPNTYSYARLHFLISSYMFSWPEVPDLVKVGDELLKHKPEDEPVKYQFIQVLQSSKSTADRQRAILYAKQLVAETPQKSDNHISLGSAYQAMWIHTHKRIYGEKAISEYQNYLRLAPPNSPYRKTADRYIKLINLMQAQWDKKTR